MDLKIGELYTSSRLGLFIVTNLFPINFVPNEQIGTCERLNFGDRVYKLYNDTRIREANDSDIEEFLLFQLNRFPLNIEESVIIDENGISIFADQEAVYLNKDAALKLKEILNRELN